MQRFLVILLCLSAYGCVSSTRLVRPTSELFSRERRAELWDRAVLATVQNNERILVSDRETGVITTSTSTLLLSPSGALSYITPMLLSDDAAAEEERANLAFVRQILSNGAPSGVTSGSQTQTSTSSSGFVVATLVTLSVLAVAVPLTYFVYDL